MLAHACRGVLSRHRLLCLRPITDSNWCSTRSRDTGRYLRRSVLFGRNRESHDETVKAAQGSAQISEICPFGENCHHVETSLQLRALRRGRRTTRGLPSFMSPPRRRRLPAICSQVTAWRTLHQSLPDHVTFKVSSFLPAYIADRVPLHNHGSLIGGVLDTSTTLGLVRSTLIQIWKETDQIQNKPFFIKCDDELHRHTGRLYLSEPAFRDLLLTHLVAIAPPPVVVAVEDLSYEREFPTVQSTVAPPTRRLTFA